MKNVTKQKTEDTTSRFRRSKKNFTLKIGKSKSKSRNKGGKYDQTAKIKVKTTI